MFNEYPYTDYHELNTDWIIGKIKNVETAEANTKQYAEDADAAKIAAQDARDIAIHAKDDAVEAKDDAVEAKDDAISFLNDTKDQLDLLQARVDNIIPDGTQTAGNTELLDIRVAADGTIWDSAGNAVRGQVSHIQDAAFSDPVDTTGITVEDHKLVNATNGNIEGWGTAPYGASGQIDISDFAGMAAYITAEYYGTAGAAFYDENSVYITGTSGGDISDPSTTPQALCLEIPVNAKYVRITLNRNNLDISDYPIVCSGAFHLVRPLVDTLCDDYQEVVKGSPDLSGTAITLNSIIQSADGNVQTYIGFHYVCSDYVPIGALQGVPITFLCTVNGTAGAAFYDIDKEFISGFGESDVDTPSTTPQSCTAVVPAGAAYFRFTGYDSYSTDAEDYPITYSDKLNAFQAVTNVQGLVESTQQDVDALVSTPGNPLFPLSTLSVFENFGVVGDSYASGEIIVGGVAGDYYPLSWGQNIARMCGNTCKNFSEGGLTTKTWLTSAYGLALMQSEAAQQLYFICLGLNDQTAISGGTYTLGSESDLNPDYHDNPDTFYGNYGRIIGEIADHAPDAKIIICSVTEGQPNDFATVNPAIKTIATHYSLPYINLRDDPFFTSQFYRDAMNLNHPVAVSYGGYALGLMRLFSKCAVDYLSYFMDYVG